VKLTELVAPPTEGRVFTITGGDWDEIAESLGEAPEERIVVNMGPQHPSTHGVLRLILELEGETVTEARCGIGFLHTGIEKSAEFRNWTQGTTLVTRMDYLTPFFQEVAYCLAVEKLLGVEDQVPDRASVIPMLDMNRSSPIFDITVPTTPLPLRSPVRDHEQNGAEKREEADRLRSPAPDRDCDCSAGGRAHQADRNGEPDRHRIRSRHGQPRQATCDEAKKHHQDDRADHE